MHIDCPQCQVPIDIVIEQPTEPIVCPSCGSSFSLFDPTRTVTYREQQIREMGRFELTERLGSGHFGEVWLAEDSMLSRQVALKIPRKEVLDREDVELFLREARVAAQLRHPHIVQVFEIGRHKGVTFIVSEYIAGVNLAELLREFKPDFTTAARLCATLADALDHAHSAGVIHRDVKPSNILIDRNQEPHLTDFGLAKREAREFTITVDGRILGTAAYMPPEQARGDGHHADCRSDVYSLGVVLFEMLTGRRPFEGKSKLLLIQQVLTQDAPFPHKLQSGIPRDLETICMKAIAKEPSRRYQTAREFAEDLRRFLEGKPIRARRTGMVERSWRWAKRNSALALAGALAVLASALALILSIGNYTAADPGGPRRPVRIETIPTGAEVSFIPLGAGDGEPLADQRIAAGKSPVEIRLRPGRYLVVADAGEDGFHEVFRQVPTLENPNPAPFRHLNWEYDRQEPTEGAVSLPSIRLFPLEVTDGMVHFDGSPSFTMGAADVDVSPVHERSVPPFYLDSTEVTLKQYREEMGDIPPELRGQPPADDFPVTFISVDMAINYAESIGKRLMHEAEYEFAATNGGQSGFPWGDAPPAITTWQVESVGTPAADRTRTIPAVAGLFSGALEWTSSWDVPYPGLRSTIASDLAITYRVVRGGPRGVIDDGRDDSGEWKLGPRYRVGVEFFRTEDGVGFRCARSARPRKRAGDFVQIRTLR